MDLRAQCFVPSKEFKMWLEDALVAISQIAEDKGFVIASRPSGLRNQGMEYVLDEPTVYKLVENNLIRINNKDIEVSEI